VIRGIEIIGEASTKVSRDFVSSHPNLPWKQMRDMRNVLIHAYAEVDMNVVWDVVQNDLPVLLRQLDVALSATATYSPRQTEQNTSSRGRPTQDQNRARSGKQENLEPDR
jgi:hypothetical protein